MLPALAVCAPAAAFASGDAELSLLGLTGPLVAALLYLNTLNSLRRGVVGVAERPVDDVDDGGADGATPATLGQSPQ